MVVSKKVFLPTNYCISKKIQKMLILLHPENSFFESKKHFFDIRSKKKFL